MLPAAPRRLQLPPGAEYLISSSKIGILTHENLYFDLHHDFLGWCIPTCFQVGFQQPPGCSSYIQRLNILFLKIEIHTSENLYFDLHHDFLGWCTPTCSQVSFQQPPGFSGCFQGLNILILITKFKSLPIKTYILTYIITFWVGVLQPAPRLAPLSSSYLESKFF